MPFITAKPGYDDKGERIVILAIDDELYYPLAPEESETLASILSFASDQTKRLPPRMADFQDGKLRRVILSEASDQIEDGGFS